MKKWKRILTLILSPIVMLFYSACVRQNAAPTTNVIEVYRTNTITLTNYTDGENTPDYYTNNIDEPYFDDEEDLYMGPAPLSFRFTGDALEQLRKDMLM